MAKYSKGAAKKVETVMKEMKKGSLKTGSGKKVTDKKQAVAIGLSEARKAGSKVPSKKAAQKSAPKKSAAKQAAPKKSAAKKATAPKKVAPKKAAAKKSAAPKKAAAKKAASKKTAAPQKSAPKNSAPKKASAMKTAVSKKSAAKKAATKPPVSKHAAAKKTVAPQKAAARRRSAAMPAPQADTAWMNEKPAGGPKGNTPEPPVTEPTRERDDITIPVEEPTITDTPAEAQGSPIPKDLYSTPGDSFHGQTKATRSKSSVRPSGKKPLWNK